MLVRRPALSVVIYLTHRPSFSYDLCRQGLCTFICDEHGPPHLTHWMRMQYEGNNVAELTTACFHPGNQVRTLAVGMFHLAKSNQNTQSTVAQD